MASFSLPIADRPAPPDDCGPCNVCCHVVGVPDLGKPFFTTCVDLSERGCGIYETRPGPCRKYRCAWHLGMLGPRTDRRPNEMGVIFQFDQTADGQWVLGLYEAVAGAADSDKARFLRDIILTSKHVRHLRFAQPAWRILRYGSDVAINYEIAEPYRAQQSA